jgi:hypothetical protein
VSASICPGRRSARSLISHARCSASVFLACRAYADSIKILEGLAAIDFYQGIVIDYIRADRSLFVNTETCIQLNAAPNPDTSASLVLQRGRGRLPVQTHLAR